MNLYHIKQWESSFFSKKKNTKNKYFQNGCPSPYVSINCWPIFTEIHKFLEMKFGIEVSLNTV